MNVNNSRSYFLQRKIKFSKGTSVDISMPGLRHRPQNDLHPSPISIKSPRVPLSVLFHTVVASRSLPFLSFGCFEATRAGYPYRIPFMYFTTEENVPHHPVVPSFSRISFTLPPTHPPRHFIFHNRCFTTLRFVVAVFFLLSC